MARYPLWTQEERDLVRQLAEQGATSTQIASRVGRSAGAVRHMVGVMARAGQSRALSRWTADMDKELRALRKAGKSQRVIGDLLGVSNNAVRRRLAKMQNGEI